MAKKIYRLLYVRRDVMSALKKAISCGDEITLKSVRFKGSIISGQTSIPLNHNVLRLVYKNLSKILHAMKL